MKKSHLFGILVIGIAILVIITTAGDASTYVSFKEAKNLAEKGKDTKVHVVGKLNKNEKGEIVGIEPSADKLSFSFQMVDNNHEIQQVFYKDPMPPDFKRSEQIVVVGTYKNSAFYADQILLKCPSKYKEESVKVSAVNQY